MIQQWLRNDFTISKRGLGVLMIGAGIVLAAVMVGVEMVGTDSQGLGVVQWLGIIGGVCSAALGLTLLPLDDQPA